LRTLLERAVSTEYKFWTNDQKVATGTVLHTLPATLTASETFDVGGDKS
jgi:hypothetical protein